MLMTLDGNTTLQETYRIQLDATLPTKKQAWKQLIESKIRNQSNLLLSLEKDGNALKPYYMNVKSGDSDNREGAAARIYWGLLFGDSFRRQRDGDPPNSLLNYGYTILRAAVARALLGSGLYPAFGLYHRNRYNSFPLADDVMEPYRPFVDQVVFDMFANGDDFLSSETKAQLQRVLFMDVTMENVTRPLEVALSMTTASLAKVLKGDESKLSLPVLK
jgi:CRISPR-associated protein Cas1